MLKPERIVPPVLRPVHIDWVRDVCRISVPDEDAYLDVAIDAAIEHVDGWAGILRRCLINQTWRESFDAFPSSGILRLALAPLQSIAEVKYFDGSNAEQTLSTASYDVYEDDEGVYLRRPDGVSWPTVYDRDDAVQVSTVYGYGANMDDIPASLRSAIAMLANHYFEERNPAIVGTIAGKIPYSIDSMFDRYRRPVF